MKINSGKLIILLVAASSILSMSSIAAIITTWGTAAGGLLKDSGGSLLHGNSTIGTGYTLGTYVQLIWTGGDGLVSSFDGTSLTGINTLADDKVVATAWVGKGIFPPGTDGGSVNGIFSDTSSITTGTSLGSTFYVRFFDTVSPNYASGYVPTSGKYADITNPSWTITQGNIDSSTVSFGISGNQLATVSIVPEPTSFALLGLGVAMIALRRRFVK
jgi:hypothetical protein